MSPTLLLEKEKPEAYETVAALDQNVRKRPQVHRDADPRMQIQFRCMCVNHDGRHDRNCIYNLV